MCAGSMSEGDMLQVTGPRQSTALLGLKVSGSMTACRTMSM
jgi:hypothetical protein